MIIPLRVNPRTALAKSSVAQKARSARAQLNVEREILREISAAAAKHGIDATKMWSTGQLGHDAAAHRITVDLYSSKWSMHGFDKPEFIKDLKSIARKAKAQGVTVSVGVSNNPLLSLEDE